MKKKIKKVVIYKTAVTDQKNEQKRESHASSLFIYALLGYLLLVAAFLIRYEAFPPGESIPKKAYSAESSTILFSPALLSASRSASPVITLPLTLTGDTWTASAPAIKAEPEDYCIDVPVLMYHHVQPLPMAQLLGHPQLTVDSSVFDEHIRYLISKGYTFITLEELANALRTEQPLPAKPIVITIDDGYDDNYTYAFTTAKKYHAVMNFMIPSALIEKPGYMLWEHLKEMTSNPYAKIYNHTATHAPLGYISDEEIEAELSSSSAAFTEHLGLTNTIFAYPYGSFSDSAVEKVKEHGFTAAISTIDGRNQCRSQIMTLPRLRIGNAPIDAYGL